MQVNIKRYKSGKSKGSVYKQEVKIDYYDTWSAEWTLAQIAYPLLVQLKEDKQGAPYTVDDDVPEELRSYNAPPKEQDWDTDEFHFLRWDWILQEMIYAMKEIAENNPEEPVVYKKVRESEMKEHPNGAVEVIDSGLEEIEGMKEERLKYTNRVQNGCRLFGVYFQNLWS